MYSVWVAGVCIIRFPCCVCVECANCEMAVLDRLFVCLRGGEGWIGGGVCLHGGGGSCQRVM